MSNNKLKFKKHRVTDAEALLRQKHDETLAMISQMNNKAAADEAYEKKLANERKLARLAAIRQDELLRQQRAGQTLERENSASTISRSQAGGAIGLSGSLNVQINQSVNVETRRKRTKKSKGAKSVTEKQRQKELMNSSLSKMLDQQLLLSNQAKAPVDYTKDVTSNVVGDSLTQKIFHGDKIYLNNGAMAFKPLGMETVLELDEHGRNNMQTGVTNYNQRSQAPQTTEQNIAMQQQLDFASAEDFISFPRQSMLNLSVKEDRGSAYVSPLIQRNQYLNTGSSSKNNTSLFASRSASKELISSAAKRSMVKQESKSSLKTITVQTPSKHPMMEESRSVHPGLHQMTLNLSSHTPSIRGQQLPLYHPYRQNTSVTDYYQVQEQQHQQSVQFDESTMKKFQSAILTKRSDDSINVITGANAAQEVTSSDPAQAPIGLKLHRQVTGNTKSLSRKLREKRFNTQDGQNEDEAAQEEEKLAMDTVMENPPPKPHRMRSNATFQPKSTKIEPNLVLPNEKLLEHSDNISQLAIDYTMHQQNKQRIINLMLLLDGKGGKLVETNISDIDLHIGDSMSNVDITSQNALSKRSKLPSINQRGGVMDVTTTDDPRSTQAGTNAKSSVLNLAQYTKLKNRKTSEPPKPRLDNSDNGSQEPEIQSRIDHIGIDNKSQEGQSSLEGHRISDQRGSIAAQSQDFIVNNVDQRITLRNKVGKITGTKSALDNLTNMHFLNQGHEVSYHGVSPMAYNQNGKLKIPSREQGNVSSSLRRNGGSRKFPTKFGVVRSSMFNKNPIFDRMDVGNMAVMDDNASEYSVGYASQATRNLYNINQSDRYSTIAPDDIERRSMHSAALVRSLSSKKLRPIGSAFQKSIEGTRTEKHSALKSQSLVFNKGLSYVMVKGKVQPSEKYISKAMMPYTGAQAYQSIQIKSSTSRHQILITEMPNQLGSKQSPARTSKVPTKNSKVKKSGKASKNGAVSRTQQKQALISSRKKGVIYEMEEADEFSGSEQQIDTQAVSPEKANNNDGQETWLDVQEENALLKTQILNQIAIFEQYLKVAVLQHKQREKAEKEADRRNGASVSLEPSMFKAQKDFEFDDKKTLKKFLKQTASKRGKTKPSKKTNASPKPEPLSTINSPKTGGRSFKNQIQTQVQQTKSISRVAHSPTRSSIAMLKDNSRTQQRNNVMVSHQRNNSADSLTSGQRQVNGVTTKIVTLSKKVTNQQMKKFEHLIPLTDEMNTKITAHTAHQEWISRIEKLWARLERHRNQDCVQVQNEIRKNKQQINQLTRDNLFELDVNTNEQKLLLTVSHKRKKIKKIATKNPQLKQIEEVQTRIRAEIQRKQEFDTWGFHDHIIQYRLKVRMTEDIIDCAQRLVVKADARTQRELDLLKMLRDRTYDDIRHFVNEREKKKWRIWDGFGYYKPFLENMGLNLNQLEERIDIHLVMISYLEPRYSQLIHEIPPYNTINSEMIQFCTMVFGNEGWLQMFQLRQLRKQQEAEQHNKQYMPPVDQIKKLEVDPYTLQVESDGQEEVKEEAQPENAAEVNPVKKKMGASAWRIRKPAKPNQSNLMTGYEPIIEKRQQKQQISGTIEIERVDDSAMNSPTRNTPARKPSEREGIKRTGTMPVEADGKIIRLKGTTSEISIDDNESRVAHSVMHDRSGFGAKRFEGDVVQHLKDQADQLTKQDKVKDEVNQIQKSSWLQVLEKERLEKAKRADNERKARAARLAVLFEEEDVLSQDDEDLLDAGAAQQDVATYIDKINTHLQVEKRILEAWNENDKKEGP